MAGYGTDGRVRKDEEKTESLKLIGDMIWKKSLF